MSDQDDDIAYSIEFTIGGVYVYAAYISSEDEMKPWRDFAEGRTDEVTQLREWVGNIHSRVVADGEVAKITFCTDFGEMSADLPAALVRAEIARCLEEPIDWSATADEN